MPIHQILVIMKKNQVVVMIILKRKLVNLPKQIM